MYCSVEAVCDGGWGGQLLPGEVVCYFQSIVSTSCGSGVIGAGCCRLDGVRAGEGSQQGRPESGHTHSTTVAGRQLACLAFPLALLPVQSVDSSEAGKETQILNTVGYCWCQCFTDVVGVVTLHRRSGMTFAIKLLLLQQQCGGFWSKKI